jgi:hypothetical protein
VRRGFSGSGCRGNHAAVRAVVACYALRRIP